MAPEPTVVVVGAGAAGLVAALTAAAGGVRVLLLEKSATGAKKSELQHASNTSRSSGLIPAAGTTLQAAAGVTDDTAELLAADILRVNGGCDAEFVRQVAKAAASTVDFLAQILPSSTLECKTDFLYPGHGRLRMHGPVDGYGRRLHEDLLAAALASPNISIVYTAYIDGLLISDADGQVSRVQGLRLQGGGQIAADAVVLATNGFGANKAMVQEHLGPQVAAGLYLGSPLNTGDGISWAVDVGAGVAHMTAYQGHATVAEPDGPLVTWGVIVNGGVLVDMNGCRFGNELKGYSEFAEDVMALPSASAVEIFPQSCYQACVGTRLDEVITAGKVESFNCLAELCARHHLPISKLRETLRELRAAAGGRDRLGRDWSGIRAWAGVDVSESDMTEPLYTVRVRAALFHTQGGLLTDTSGLVLRPGGQSVAEGLYAAGGTAAGMSGDGAAGYLSGNGLLHAVVSGRWAGEAASASAQRYRTAAVPDAAL